MLLDIEMRNALDTAWEAPPDEPQMAPPEYYYVDQAVKRIQTDPRLASATRCSGRRPTDP